MGQAEKQLVSDIKRGRSLTSYYQWQNTLYLGKINSSPIETQLTKKKNKSKIKTIPFLPTHPPPPISRLSFTPNFCTFPGGGWGYGLHTAAPLCCSFTHASSLPHGSFPRAAAAFRDTLLLWRGALHGLQGSGELVYVATFTHFCF